jgi:hypothetical protein
MFLHSRSGDKVLRCIFGAVQDKSTWRKRYNYELYKLFNEPDIIKYIKINRLSWAGHIIRMENNRTVKKVFDTRPLIRVLFYVILVLILLILLLLLLLFTPSPCDRQWWW